MASFTPFITKTVGIGTLIGSLLSAACTSTNPAGAGGAGGSGGGGPVSCETPSRPTQSMLSGWRTDPLFKGYKLTYPSDGQPMGGMVIITGFIIGVAAMDSWGPYMASRGMATLLIDPPSNVNNPTDRHRAQLAALESLKAEATRPGSPLNGKLDVNRLAVAGWSMGGGATLRTANANPAGVKAAVAFAPWETGGFFPLARVPSLVLTGGPADSLVPREMSRGEYDSLSATLPKAYVEWAGCDHMAWTSPNACGGQAGPYTWAWVNAFANGVSECKSVIRQTAQMPIFHSANL